MRPEAIFKWPVLLPLISGLLALFAFLLYQVKSSSHPGFHEVDSSAIRALIVDGIHEAEMHVLDSGKINDLQKTEFSKNAEQDLRLARASRDEEALERLLAFYGPPPDSATVGDYCTIGKTLILERLEDNWYLVKTGDAVMVISAEGLDPQIGKKLLSHTGYFVTELITVDTITYGSITNVPVLLPVRVNIRD